MDKKLLVSAIIDTFEFKAYNLISISEKDCIEYCKHAMSVIDEIMLDNDVVYTELPLDVKRKYRYLLQASELTI